MGMHDVGIGNVTSAYWLWSRAVSGVSLIGMATIRDNHPAHEETVCGEQLCAMQTPLNQYPAHTRGSIMHMTARASGRRAGGKAVCIGKILWSVR